MFSSNPFQQHLPSSIHVFPPSNSFFDLEKDGGGGVHFNHHHHHQFPPPPAAVTGQQQQQLSKESTGFHYCDDNSNLLESVINYPSKKKMGNLKKDGHSKIHTAQGPRDRRVRLSIEVARKFFYLQDLLGFDKASKTLDWLFTKSKTSIKELVEEMKHCSSSDANDQCEVVFQDTIKKGLVEEGQQKKSKYFEGRKKLQMIRKNKSGVDVNQSRAEARARARERTKEKLQSKKLDVESKKGLDVDGGYRVINPSTITFQTSFNWSQNESSVMEQKVSSSLLYGYNHHQHQHNHVVVSNDLSSSEIRYPNYLQ